MNTKNSVVLSVLLFAMLALIGSAAATLTSVTLSVPANGTSTYVTNVTPTFTFVPLGNFTSNCTLYVNGTDVGTGFNLTNNTAANIVSNTTLAQGLHTWFVNCSNNGSTIVSSTFVFTLDSLPPNLFINSPATNGYVSSLVLTINLTVNESNINFTIIGVIDSSGIVISSTNNSNVSNFVVVESVPSEGTYNISATSYDFAGLASNNVVVSNLTVDTTNPSISLGAGTGAGNTLTTSITVNVSANDTHLSNVTIYIYNATSIYLLNFSTTASLHTFTSIPDGNYSYNATAFDLAGNKNSTATVSNIVIDTTAPVITLSGLTNNSVATSADVTFNVTALDGLVGVANCWVVFENGTTSATSTNCTNQPVIFSNLSESTHNITFYATDTLGNERIAAYYFTVDVSAPSVTINSPPSTSFVSTSTMNVNLTVVEPDILNTNITIYNITGGVYNSTVTASTGNFVVQFYSLADSTYNLTAITFDNAGHNMSTSVSNVIVDTTNPTIVFGGGNTTPGNSVVNSIKVNVTGSDAHFVGLNIFLYNSTGLYTNMSTTALSLYNNFTSVPDGNYSYNATAYDAAGHTAFTSTIHNVVIDTTSPAITTNEQDYYNTNNVSITFNLTDALVGNANCYLVNESGVNTSKTNTNCNFLVSYVNLTEGTHNVTVVANDTLGNTITHTYDFVVDTIMPTVTTVAAVSSVTATTATITMTTSEPTVKTIDYGLVTLNNSQVHLTPANETVFSLTDLTAESRYNYSITYCDLANNCATTDQTNFVTSSASSGGSGGGSSGGGGGGGSNSVYLTASGTADSASLIYGSLPAGTKDFVIDNMLLTDMIITSVGTSSNVHFVITKTATASTPYSDTSKTVYAYLTIDHENLANENISSAKIRFKVDKVWLTSNSFDKSNVVLSRLGTAWTELPTRVLSDDTTYVYFEADSPGLSTFAIVAGAPATVVVTPPVAANETTQPIVPAATPATPEATPATPVVPKATSTAYLWIIIIVAVVIIALVILATRTSKKGRK